VDEIPNNNSTQERVKIEKVVPQNISLDKKELMNKVLDNMSDVINPDLDNIADAIYEQLKENNVEIEKNVVKNVVTKHYRASTETAVKSTSSTEKQNESFDSSLDRDKLKLVVDDLYIQIENENKIEELNKAKEKAIVQENLKKTKEKEQVKTKEIPSKNKEKEKPLKKNDVSKLLLEDDELDLSDNEESDDDLGLKF
jgi:hypothetical protein